MRPSSQEDRPLPADPPPAAPPSINAADARRAARNTGALVVASVASKGLLFIWQIVLGTWLGPAEYGIYNTVVSLLAIGASLAGFGMGLIAVREVARAPEKTGAYWSAMLFMQTGLGLVAYLGVLAMGLASGYSDVILAYTAIAGVSLLVDITGNICHDLLIAHERMVVTSAVEIAHILLRIGLAAGALALGWGLLGVYAATIFSGVLRGALLWGVHWHRGTHPQWDQARTVARPLLIDAAPLAFSAFLSLAYQHTDKLMTTAVVGETGTGYLSPAFVINFGVIEVLSTTVLVAVYPLMSRYYAQGSGEMFGFMVEKLARFMLTLGLPIALVLSVFADVLILTIYGAAYAPTVAILRIFIWYTLLTIVGNVFQKGLLIQNRQRLLLLIRAGGLALNIGLNLYFLGALRDARGAAIASVITETLALGAMAMLFHTAGFQWSRVLPAMLRVIAVALLSGAVMIALRGVHDVAAVLAGLALYTLGVIYGTLDTADYDLIYRLVAAMPGGDWVRRRWKRDTAINW